MGMGRKPKLKKPAWKIHWGFPIASKSPEPSGHPGQGDSEEPTLQDAEFKRKEPQRGISLLIAIMAIAVMITFISEMIVSSTVNVEMSILGRDRIKSEYLVKSGFNLGLYFLTANYLWDHVQASGVMGPKIEPTDGPEALWNIINTLPPMGSDTLSMMKLAAGAEGDPFNLSGFMNEKISDQMSLLEGQFSVKVTDEKSKININDCYNTSERSACREVLVQLESLFSCPAEKAFLESKNLTPKEMAYRIRDFILDYDRVSSFSNMESKDGPYEAQTPSYKSKRVPFDTLEELRLVKGWDDDMHAVFSPYMTIYPHRVAKVTANSKAVQTNLININTAPRELLTCLIPQARDQSYREKAVQALYKAQKKQKNLASDQKKMKEKLTELFGYTGEGIEEEAEKAEKWFTTRTDYFRLEVNAQTGHQERKLVAVIRRVNSGVTDSSVRQRDIKRAWQVLYWKLI